VSTTPTPSATPGVVTDPVRRRPAPALPAAALVLGLVVLGLLVLLSLAVGQRDVAPGEVVRAFTDPGAGNPDHVAVRTVRLPRTALALLVGAALAVGGALVQTMTRNPLAEPGILGVTAGAALAVVVTTILLPDGSQAGRMLAACAGAAAATVVVHAVGRAEPLRMVLAGVALTAVLSGVSLAIRLADAEAFDSHRFWSVGSLAGREQLPLLLPALVVGAGLVAALLLSRPLDAIALGEEVAHGLGVPVLRVRVLTVVTMTVLAGVATAVAGPIAFVGLIVPHVARRVAGGSVPWLVTLSIVLGGALLVGSDVLARVLLPTGDVPVAIVTAVLGGPVLVWVVRRRLAGA